MRHQWTHNSPVRGTRNRTGTHGRAATHSRQPSHRSAPRGAQRSARRTRAATLATTVAVTLGVAALAGCSTLGAGPNAASAPASPAPSAAGANPNDPFTYSDVEVTPDAVQAAVGQLDDLVNAQMQRTGIPGASVSVVYRGQQVYAKGFGVTDASTKTPVDADTAFQVASISKPVASSVVADVIGDGKLTWDTPITTHLPDFALQSPWVTRNVTIADQFSMRSGLPDFAGDDLAQLGYDRDQVLQRLRYLPLSPFRAQAHYTNFGFTAAAEASARAAGSDWDRLAAERVLTPLGMTRSTYSHAEFNAQPNRAILHKRVGDEWSPIAGLDSTAFAPAGGLSTSANDFSRWMIAMLDDGAYAGTQVVDPAALAEARVPRMPTEPSSDAAARTTQMGYGWLVYTDAAGRVRNAFSGAFTPGAATTFILLPSEDLGISIFTNATPVGAAETIAASFLDLVEAGRVTVDWAAVYDKAFAGLTQVPQSPWTVAAPSGKAALPLSAYAGTYANEYYGPVVVTVSGTESGGALAGRLTATIGPKRVQFPLSPYDGDVFAAPRGSVFPGLGDDREALIPAVRFVVKDGRVASVEFTQFDAPGNRSFTRE